MASRWHSIERVACVALVAASCTVDAGTTSANACAPSPAFFVSDVWPRYLASNLCASAGCHTFDGGQGVLRFHDVERDPAPSSNLALADWPSSWRENDLAAIQYLRCDAPLESRLLTMPEGIGNLHPPGPVVRDRVTAMSVIEQWVATP